MLLDSKKKVANSDAKARNYWYWFLSDATQRDLLPFFNDANPGWGYGVGDKFGGTAVIGPKNYPTWQFGDPATFCEAVPVVLPQFPTTYTTTQGPWPNAGDPMPSSGSPQTPASVPSSGTSPSSTSVSQTPASMPSSETSPSATT